MTLKEGWGGEGYEKREVNTALYFHIMHKTYSADFAKIIPMMLELWFGSYVGLWGDVGLVGSQEDECEY